MAFTLSWFISVCLQLLLGLYDVSDVLGELTLRAIADIVPICGGGIISPKRRPIFTDGLPDVSVLQASFK